jgi:hypothetical protein
MLDGCTVGTTCELLSLLRDAQGLSGNHDAWCKCNTLHGELSSPGVQNFVSSIVFHEVPGCSGRSRLGRFVFLNQHDSQVEPWTKQSPELEYIYPFRQPTPPFAFPPVLYTPTACWSRHQVTCTKHSFSFQYPSDNLHRFVRSLWDCFRYSCIIMLTSRM